MRQLHSWKGVLAEVGGGALAEGVLPGVSHEELQTYTVSTRVQDAPFANQFLSKSKVGLVSGYDSAIFCTCCG